jgi:hypothetical protein
LIWGTGKYAGIEGNFEIHHTAKSAIEGVMPAARGELGAALIRFLRADGAQLAPFAWRASRLVDVALTPSPDRLSYRPRCSSLRAPSAASTPCLRQRGIAVRPARDKIRRCCLYLPDGRNRRRVRRGIASSNAIRSRVRRSLSGSKQAGSRMM